MSRKPANDAVKPKERFTVVLSMTFALAAALVFIAPYHADFVEFLGVTLTSRLWACIACLFVSFLGLVLHAVSVFAARAGAAAESSTSAVAADAEPVAGPAAASSDVSQPETV